MRRIAAAVVLAALAVAAPGQDRPAPAGKADPQSTIEPRSGPGAGQAFLAKFVGDWDVAKTFYSRSGEAARSKGTCRQTMIHGGRFLQSEFTFGEGKDATTGLGLTGFDPATGRFTTVWTDSRATRMSLRQSRDKFDGEMIVLYAAALDDGTTRPSRTVTKLEDGGKRIVHRQYSVAPQGAGADRLVMELMLTKKAAAK
ncbi:MAG TPA: DUF1579 family protein [Gemmataceae bacterium]|jgi:hypothetical protein